MALTEDDVASNEIKKGAEDDEDNDEDNNKQEERPYGWLLFYRRKVPV